MKIKINGHDIMAFFGGRGEGGGGARGWIILAGISFVLSEN